MRKEGCSGAVLRHRETVRQQCRRRAVSEGLGGHVGVSRASRPWQRLVIHVRRRHGGFQGRPSQRAPQPRSLAARVWKRARRSREAFLGTSKSRRKQREFTQARAAGLMRALRPTGLHGGEERSARKKGKASLSRDARSRGVLPTCAHAIGRARADVPAAARARTAARAAPPWKLMWRARSRGLPRPRPLPANPLVQTLFAPS